MSVRISSDLIFARDRNGKKNYLGFKDYSDVYFCWANSVIEGVLAPEDSSIVVYLALDDDHAWDYSGKSNHGVISGVDANTCWSDGKIGKTLEFDGGDDSVEIAFAESLNFENGSFSIKIWIRPTSLSSGTYSILQYNPDSYSDGYLLCQNGNHLFVYIDSSNILLNY